jgi:peptide/nickel transport system permease protein
MGATESVTRIPVPASPFQARLTIVARRVREVWRQILHNPSAMAGLCICTFFLVLALAAPFIAPYGPIQPVNDAAPLTLPNAQHLLGVSRNGNDIFSQVIWGTQVSLLVGLLSAVVASVIGTAVGLISGFVGGWVDEVIMRFNDIVLSIPWLVLMIIVAARLHTIDLLGVILVIGLTGWSVTARVIRSQVLSVKERMFVERAKMIGSSGPHILLRHIFPNAFPLIFANTILTIAVSILSESVLAFLNLSVQRGISWGRIIAEAFSNNAVTIGNAGWLLVPGLCIVFLVFGFYLFGYALDEILNPRLRRR